MHVMRERPLAELLNAFAARIRDPLRAPQPGSVAGERMAVYEELFYNNIDGVLSDSFPVLRALHNKVDWQQLVRDFFARHRCRSPFFNQVAKEFLDYLQHERRGTPGYPFTLELAHYEWLEMELSISAEELPPAVEKIGNTTLLNSHHRVSPLARILSYNYPVHTIGPGHIPLKPEPVQLLVYRDRNDHIGFLRLNPVSTRLLQLIEAAALRNHREMLQQIAEELHHPNHETVIQGGLALLRELVQRDILIDERHAP